MSLRRQDILRQVYNPVSHTGEDVIGQIIYAMLPGRLFSDVDHITQLVKEGASVAALTLFRQHPGTPARRTAMTHDLSQAVIESKRPEVLRWMWVSYTPKEVWDYMHEPSVIKLAQTNGGLETLKAILLTFYAERSTVIWGRVLDEAMVHNQFETILWLLNNLEGYTHEHFPRCLWSISYHHVYARGYSRLFKGYLMSTTDQERNEYLSTILLCFKRLERFDEPGHYSNSILSMIIYSSSKYRSCALLERLHRLDGLVFTRENDSLKLIEMFVQLAPLSLVTKMLPPPAEDTLFYARLHWNLYHSAEVRFRNTSLDIRMFLCRSLHDKDIPERSTKAWFDYVVECGHYWIAEAIYCLYGHNDPTMGLSVETFHKICERGCDPVLLRNENIPVLGTVESITVDRSKHPWAYPSNSPYCMEIYSICRRRGIEIKEVNMEGILAPLTDIF